MNKTETAVRAFVRQQGLKVSPNPRGSPLIGEKSRDAHAWFHVFDSWEDARDTFSAWRNAKIDQGTPYPWERKTNPGQPGKPVHLLTASELRAKLAKAEAASMRVIDQLIEAGRGNERPSEMRGKTDALSRLWQLTVDREGELRAEQKRRQEYQGNDRPIKRKENPVATTRKKQPTAAQKAARAEFARIMKSGGFSATRRKNPVGRSGANDRDQQFLDGARPRRKNPAPARRPAAAAARPAIRRIAPVGSLAGRKANPIYPVARFEVWRTGQDARGSTRAERFIAAFASKTEAVTYAKLYADNHNRRVGIIIRGKRH